LVISYSNVTSSIGFIIKFCPKILCKNTNYESVVIQ